MVVTNKKNKQIVYKCIFPRNYMYIYITTEDKLLYPMRSKLRTITCTFQMQSQF